VPNVLIYSPIVGRGGVHRMVTRLLEHWRSEKGWKFTVLSQAADEVGQPIDWQGVEFIQIDGGTPPPHPALFDWMQQNQPVFHAHWQRVAKAKKIDISYFPMPWWTTRLPDFKPATPFAVTLHDFSWDQLQMPLHEFRGEARNFAEHAALTVFPSDYQRKWGEQHYGFRHTQTIYHGHFIPAGFMVGEIEGKRVRAKYGLPEKYVLAFHCANDKKDPVSILAAQFLARGNSPDVPPLVIAGLDTQWLIPGSLPLGHYAYGAASRWWQIIQHYQYTLGRDLFILGSVPVEDMGGLYANAQAAVTATRNEGGISGSMFEAFAAHVPCIYTDLPMFSERLTPNQYGYVFQPGDVPRFADAIIAACTQTDEAYARAERAFAFANSRTWADAAGEYLKAFKTTISG
jgi:glycosyltransferase involved in cell wall biosynthesis